MSAELSLAPAAKVTKKKGKQTDLPTMENHERRIAEIEDLADIQLDLTDQLSALKEKLKEADDNLVASMKRHDRTFYQRQTWGSVLLTEAKVKVKVKKQVAATKDEPDADSDADD